MGPEPQKPTREPFYLIASALLCLMVGVDVLFHTAAGIQPGWFDYAAIAALVVLAVGGVVLYARGLTPPKA